MLNHRRDSETYRKHWQTLMRKTKKQWHCFMKTEFKIFFKHANSNSQENFMTFEHLSLITQGARWKTAQTSECFRYEPTYRRI